MMRRTAYCAPDAQPAAETILDSRAGLVAWAVYDWANSGFAAVVQMFVFAAYFTRQVAPDEDVGASLWGTALGIAGLAVAVGAPVLGAIADQSGRHKPWIVAFTLGCVAATALLWFVQPSPAYVGPALAALALATVCSECSYVSYNAMLPQLAPADHVGRWSGWGWSLGYVGGVACLVLALLAFVAESPWLPVSREAARNVRATFVFTAAWYLIFALPFMLVTRDTPGTGKPLRRAVRDGLRQLRDSFREIRRYRHILRFLIAHMIYMDALATVFVFGGVYAAGTFDMDERQVLLFGIALNVAAGAGAAMFAWLDDLVGAKLTILVSLSGLMVCVVIALLAETTNLFWIAGMAVGVFVGPVQSSSRSFLARVAPKGLRNEMFGLFVLSGRATAFLGPLLASWVTYVAQSQRLGLATVLVLALAGFVVMLTVPRVEK